MRLKPALTLSTAALLMLIPLVRPAQAACPDNDHDGICNNKDVCPNDPTNDVDGDTVCGMVDNCPTMANPTQVDTDSDGPGDACDDYLNCGNPGGGVILPSPDYVNSCTLPPDTGESYSDVAFSSGAGACKITRLTDALAEGLPGANAYHEYSSMSPFNADNTRVLLRRATSGGGFSVGDLCGNVIRTASELQVHESGEPRWSTTDPDLFYYHTVGVLPSHVMKYDVETGVRTSLRQFAGSIDFGKGESDISMDGDHLVIHEGPGASNVFHRYSISTNTLGPELSDHPVNGGSISGGTRVADWCDITPLTNHVVCRFGDVGGGNSRIELYDGSTGIFMQDATTWGGHSDRGVDDEGDEVIVMVNDFVSGLSGCYPGIAKVKLWSGETTCLLNYGASVPPGWIGWWGKGSHVSINNYLGHPFALISNYDAKSIPDTRDPNPLPANWEQLWGIYFNELILVSLDGSQVHRLAHHRSREAGYYTTSRAALSGDGRFVLFDSNHARNHATGSYIDVYLLDAVRDNPPPACETAVACAVDVDIVSPDGGVPMMIGTSGSLQWSTTAGAGCQIGSVDILLSRDGPCGPFELLFDDIPDTGSHAWQVTGPAATNAYIKVVASHPGGKVEGLSAGSFPIEWPCGPCQVSYCSDVGSRCTWNETCGEEGCCSYTCSVDLSCTQAQQCPSNACSCAQ